MATELITFKVEDSFLKEIDNTVKNSLYQSRTEFIRTAIRDRMYKEKLRSLMGTARKLSRSEKIARQKELEDKDASYILRKYGLD